MNAVRRFEVGQAVAAQLDQLRFRRRRSRLQHDVRVRRLSPLLMRQADDRRYLGETTMALLTSPPADEKVATAELMTA